MSEQKKPQADWTTMHDFRGSTNEEARCSKCKLFIKGRGAKFRISNPICPVTSSTDIRALLLEHSWYGLIPHTWFWVEYRPFHLLEVRLDSYLQDSALTPKHGEAA